MRNVGRSWVPNTPLAVGNAAEAPIRLQDEHVHRRSLFPTGTVLVELR